jgi:hypothetical protein
MIAMLMNSPVQVHLGSLLLFVDIGHGTPDLSLMQVTSTGTTILTVSRISEVNRVGVGARPIDGGFIRLVKARLDQYPGIKALLPADYPTRIASSFQFRTVKAKFGERAYTRPQYRIPMECLADEFSHAGLGIEYGRMMFSR